MRREKDVPIIEEGRDKGKLFHLKEMPASQAEKWAVRAFLALTNSDVQIPENVRAAGMAGIAALGLKALGGVNYADAETLMDEMFQCVSIKPNPDDREMIRALIDNGSDGDDIEEVATRVFLRAEVFSLHVGFSVTAMLSNLRMEIALAVSQTTETSQVPSERLSPQE